MAGASLDSLSSASRLDAGGADPQDVAQSAFARHLSIDDRQAVENPRAFLYATARNIALDITRYLKHTRRHSQRVVQETAAGTVDECSPERIGSSTSDARRQIVRAPATIETALGESE